MRERDLGRHGTAELVGGGDLDLDRFAGPDDGLTGAIVTRRSRSTRTSSLASSNWFCHIRAAVRVKFGN